MFLSKFNSDGVLQWGTYFGGTDGDGAGAVVACGNNVYLAGASSSDSNIATPGCYQESYNGTFNQSDAFLARFSSDGSRIWSTYFGGDLSDGFCSAVCDKDGNVYLAGNTKSDSAIASGGSHQQFCGSCSSPERYDAFLVKFDSAGAYIWGPYYGGNNTDKGWSVAIDGCNNIYLCGETASTTNISTAGTYQTLCGGCNPLWDELADAFVAKFDCNGVRLWGTYYGGSIDERGYAVTTAIGGNVFMTGITVSSDGIASSGAHQVLCGSCGLIPPGPYTDAFLVGFNECTLGIDSASKQDVSSYGGSDGKAGIVVSGGECSISYIWNTVPPQTSDTATGLPAGTYTVTVTDGLGCSLDTTFVVDAIWTIAEDVCTVFPSPAHDFFQIHWEDPLIEKSISIIDMIGRVVYKRENISGETFTLVDCSNFRAGVYSLRIAADKVWVKRIVVH